MKTLAHSLLIVSAVAGSWSCSPSNDAPKSGKEESQATTETSVEEKDNGRNGAPSSRVKGRLRSERARLETLVPQGRIGDSATKPDMVRLPSGVEYAVLEQGSGKTPEQNAMLKLHITGWVKRGAVLAKEIWDTRESALPQEDELSKTALIEGLVLVLEDMQRGERRWVIVPSRLGYGEEGYADRVPAGADLVFDVELVDFSNPP